MKIFDLNKKVHDQCIELSSQARFNKSFSADGYVVCLYGTLLELLGSYLSLVESKKRTGTPAIFRSFLEAYVDFVNLNNDPSYVKHCHATHHEHWVKALKASQENNPYLKDIAEHKDRDAILQGHEADLAALKKEGFRPLQVTERFQKAGMEAEYKSIYRFVSGETHNGLGALVGRHLEANENDFNLVFYADFSIDDCLSQLDSLAGLMIACTKTLHTRLKTDCLKQVQSMEDELAQIRKTY